MTSPTVAKQTTPSACARASGTRGAERREQHDPRQRAERDLAAVTDLRVDGEQRGEIRRACDGVRAGRHGPATGARASSASAAAPAVRALRADPVVRELRRGVRPSRPRASPPSRGGRATRRSEHELLQPVDERLPADERDIVPPVDEIAAERAPRLLDRIALDELDEIRRLVLVEAVAGNELELDGRRRDALLEVLGVEAEAVAEELDDIVIAEL